MRKRTESGIALADVKRLLKYLDVQSNQQLFLDKISGTFKVIDKYFLLYKATNQNYEDLIKPIEYKVLKDEIVYIRVNSFYGDAFAEHVEVLKAYVNQRNSADIIIDLRNNDGGRLENALIFLDAFSCLRGISISGYAAKKRKRIIGGNPVKTRNIAILVNDATLSAAELVTLAIKSNTNATVVGEKTYGKSRIQNNRNLTDTIAVRYTIGHFEVYGQDVEGVGIIPNVMCSNLEEEMQHDYTRIVSNHESFKAIVTFAQKALKGLGYYTGDVTGYYDEYTKNCVIEYKKRIGICVDDFITKTVIDALRRDLEKAEDKQLLCAISVIESIKDTGGIND